MSILIRSITCLFLFSYTTISYGQVCELLIWSDEFDGTVLDTSKWGFDLGDGCPELCGWGNNEQQYYTNSPENVFVENGTLTITAKKDTLGNRSFSSARITTEKRMDFRYGRFEARARLPETQGLWPAFWLLSSDEVYGDWPRSGEIDIFELLGHRPNEVLGTIHTGLPHTFITDTFAIDSTASFSEDFHVFSLEWEPDVVRWAVDGMVYHEVSQDSIMPWAPFLENFYLILNVAVGGNLPGFADSSTILPQSMEVDWVRVYGQPERLQIYGEQPIIGQSKSDYNTYEIENASYIWTAPEGSTILSGQNSPKIEVAWGCMPGNINLELQTICDTVFVSYPVNQFIPLVIDGLDIASQNMQGLTYSIPQISGANYEWTVPADATITSGQGSNRINVDWGCEPGKVSVSGTGTCSDFDATFPVELQNYIVSGSAFVSENASGKTYSIPIIDNATYHWTVPEGAIITSGQGTNEITVDFGIHGGQVSVAVTNNCGTIIYSRSITIDTSNIYCDFDGIELQWNVFGGQAFEKISNPFKTGINASDHVGKTRKDPGSQSWAGVYADLGGEMNLVENPFLNMKIYSPSEGVVKFKIEDQTSGASPVELDIENLVLGEWINLTWDFSGQPNETFDRIALFFDFGDVDTSYWYFDDVIGMGPTTTGILEAANGYINIYPNPAQNTINLHTGDLFATGESISIVIVDTQGRKIFTDLKVPLKDLIKLDTSKLPTGQHFIMMSNQHRYYVKSIVIIK